MTGGEFRDIRRALRLPVLAWGRALGYAGTRQTVITQIMQYQRGARPIPPWIARLASVYGRYGVPPEYLDEPQRAGDSI